VKQAADGGKPAPSHDTRSDPGPTLPDTRIADIRSAISNGDRDDALERLLDLRAIMAWNGDVVHLLQVEAQRLFAEAMAKRDEGEREEAIALMVRSLEANPHSGEVRNELARYLGERPERDLTQECFIFPDAERAARIYGDAIQTALDFAYFGGVTGDVLEFGVLAGWTSRLFSMRMRDLCFPGRLMLFDSFDGLPRNKWDIDAQSWDVTRGVWAQEMAFGDDIKGEIGSQIDVHVHRMLARVLPLNRIVLRKGFYSESLKEPIGAKAAIIHMDCDLYQSTVEVFGALMRDDVLQDGTVLMFDDWNCNRANPSFGQRRAFGEFLAGQAGRWGASFWFHYGYNCAAFILHDRNVRPDGESGPVPGIETGVS